MIYSTCKNLILASNSPRRKEFLENIGLQFVTSGAEIDESPHLAEDPCEYVERMAFEKTNAVSNTFPDSYVIGADTAVVLGQTILGKPCDADHALDMLMSLAGKEHTVLTAYCLNCHTKNVSVVRSVATTVCFIPFSREIAANYIAVGESFDKAGAYGIQGKGSFLVERIDGSYTNVVGLPLAEVVSTLTEYNIIQPTSFFIS